VPALAPDLGALQRWMRAVLLHPGGARAGVASRAARALLPIPRDALGQVVLPSSFLDPVERLDIYARMVLQRLRDCLAKDYEAVERAIGAPAFDRLARGYVRAHPSRFYNLNRFGGKFPDYLARSRRVPHRRFAAELARLELAMAQVFDAPRSPPLKLPRLATLSPERWSRARFQAIEALQLLELEYPANEYLQAVREGRKAHLPRPRRSWVAVYRKNDVVWRMGLRPAQYTVLRSLVSGRTLESALRGALARGGITSSALRKQASAWFREWVSEGLFQRIVA
jgi:hypothetical protein